ncbi:transcriptional repressor [Candidatus Peregrinibacteria bacterium]|nr:transcriptional repressor [Candidatus Peregrinibacteria bacterium]
MKRTDSILQSLRQDGHRITKARKALIEALQRTHQPVAALELHARLSKSKVTADKVTVYRELKFLADIGVVHPVHLKDNIQRYELAPESGHKHHLVCTECKTVKDVEMACADLHNLERNIGKKSNFTVRGHSLEFYGLCSRCA